MIAPFVDDRMAPEDRRAVVEHLAVCRDCYDRYVAAKQGPERISGAALPRAGAASLLGVVVIIAIIASRRWIMPPSGIEALTKAAASAPFRAVEPRLSVNAAYHPLHRHRVAGESVYLARVDIDPASDPHLAGIAQLMSGNVRGAMELLARPLRRGDGTIDMQSTTSADVLTDLASAYYEDAIREERPIGLANSFEAAARSVEIAPRESPSRYVCALTLEALSLREDAIDAWKAYLALDHSSQWSVEARSHLSALQAALPLDLRPQLLAAAKTNDARAVHTLVKAQPLEARIYAEDELLRQWGEEMLGAETAAAATTILCANRIGQAIAEVSSDRTVVDSVHQITSASSAQKSQLAEAYLAYGAARVAYSRVRDDHARLAMLRAAARLDACRSPLAPRPVIFAAAITHYGGKNNQALDMLAGVLTRLKGKEAAYPVAVGQALWTRGLIESVKARPHEALQSYLAAQEYLVKTRESSNIAGVESGLATTYRYLGDTENDWAHQLLALQASANGSVYARRQSSVIDTALASIDAGRLRLAALLLDRVERNAEQEQDPLFQAAAIQTRSRILAARNKPREALQQLHRSADVVAAAQRTPTTARMSGDIALAQGETMTAFDPNGAIELLTFARKRLRELSLQDRQAQIDLLVGRAREAAGDLAGAEKEFRAGVDEIELQRGEIATDEERSTFTDTGRSLFDATVGLLIRRNATAEALSVVRRARMVGLTTNGAATDGASSNPGAAVSAGAPPSTLFVEYYILPQAVMTWVTHRGTTRMLRYPIGGNALSARVAAGVTRIANCSRASDCTDSAAGLFDLLLRPLGVELTSTEDIVIAPDGVLHEVPFAALFDRTARRYLVEDHALTVTLGSGVPSRQSGFQSILVAAASNPGGDLPSLGAVEAETRNAASMFATSRVLAGNDLTPARFLALAGAYDVVHFAGHAHWNERRPRFAALRLAPADQHSDGSLYAYEVTAQEFRKTRLVVLAGCDTSRGRVAGVGLLSFARVFLAAGVPQVVGSLWPADDQESASIFSDFYAALARNDSPADALRAAQRAAITRGGLASWATFQLYASGNPPAERQKER